MQNSSVRFLLIDLDGTLTDPKLGIHRSVRYAMEKLGQPLADDVDLDWVIGPPLKASLAKLLNVQHDDVLAERALSAYRERFSEIGLFENEVYPHVAETLAELVKQGYQLYLATAKPTVFATHILQHFDLIQYFTGIYGSELTGERTNKGELIGYLLEQEQLNPAECMMIGDREYDILGAKRYQMKNIAVRYGYAQHDELELAQPNYMVDDFAEILSILS